MTEKPKLTATVRAESPRSEVKAQAILRLGSRAEAVA